MIENRALYVAIAIGTLLASGCAAIDTCCFRQQVDAAIQERAGHELGPGRCCRELAIPPGVSWDDGLSEDDAVAIALWNNAAFQETLVELGLVRADVLQAGQLPNPELWLLTPVGVKQLEYAVEFPLDALWLRPKRVAAAQWEAARVAEGLVQAGLTLIRDTRLAHADVRLASDRLEIAREAAKVRARIAALADARVNAGDASPVEVAAARIDAQRAEQETARLEFDVELALDRLRHLMGVVEAHAEFMLNDENPPELGESKVDFLVADALDSRPDLAASGLAVNAAAARLQLAQCDWFRFSLINDANGRGRKGYETGPGLRAMLPIFNWNEGRIARAAAELERAAWQQTTLRDRIILEVRQASVQLAQAQADLRRWQDKIHPAVDDAIRKAERAYQEGDTGLVLVLETTRQLFEAQTREAQLRADLRRAVAELERGVGHRLTAPPEKEP